MNGPNGYLVVDKLGDFAWLADRDKLETSLRAYAGLRKRPTATTVCDLTQAWDEAKAALPADREYTLPEVAAIAGLEYRTGHQWMEAGILRGMIRGPSGSGRGVLFSWYGAMTAAVMGGLHRAGCGRKALQAAAKVLHEGSRAFGLPSKARKERVPA